MKNPKIDDYIEKQKPWQKDVLKTLRKLIFKADPKIEEHLKWGTPTYEHTGQVIWIMCAKDWIHFSFRQGALLDASHGLFEEGPDTESKAKRTIKVHEGDAVDEALIVGLVEQAVANNVAGKKVDFQMPKPGEKHFDIPFEFESLLDEHSVLEAYNMRPYYQQKGWVQWIDEAKAEATKAKRVDTVLAELKTGQYMPNKADRKQLKS